MPSLLRSTPRKLRIPNQFKPHGIMHIDWSHPLANGLIFYGFDLGTGAAIDLARGRLQQIRGQLIAAASTWGTAIKFNTAGQNAFWFNSDAEINTSPPFSWACSLVPLSLGFYFGSPDDWVINGGGGGNQVTARINSSGTLVPIGNVAVGVPYPSFNVCVGVAPNVTTARWFLNGVQQGSDTTSLTIINTSSFMMFGDSSTTSRSDPSTSWIFFGAFWNRALSQQEALQLYLDPYCFLLPAEGEMPVASTGIPVLDVLGNPIFRVKRQAWR